MYDCSPPELGFVQLPEVTATDHESADELAQDASVDVEVANLLQAQTDDIRLLDGRQGAQLIHDQMRVHIAHIEKLNRHAVRPGVRSMLAKVLADTAALAGWQAEAMTRDGDDGAAMMPLRRTRDEFGWKALDVGTPRESWEHFERAKSAPREAEDPSLLAFATAEQAYVLLDLGDAEQAAELVGYARRQAASEVPALMRTWTRRRTGRDGGRLEECGRCRRSQSA
ncbi:hypothetical protein GCM10029978_012530 [Actinoallomurus acanthiterrae]